MNSTVEEYTSINLTTINLNASLEQALRSMNEKGIRHLLVMEDEELVGVVSERNVVANIGKRWSSPLRVKEVMSTDILYAHVQDNLSTVAYRLSTSKKGSAIVLDNEGELYGIFTTTDALNALVDLRVS